ncbi:hypothetical protein GCM10029992_37530 [Glycomyces albus]
MSKNEPARCADPDCTSGQAPPAGYDTCETCAWEQHLVERETQLRVRIADLEARLADRARPRPALTALLGRFGSGARLGMCEAIDLLPGDVFAWPCAQIRNASETNRLDQGGWIVEVAYTHDTVELLPAYGLHLIVRPGDAKAPCEGCGRTYIEGCAEPCHTRFITEVQIKAVFAEAGMSDLTGPATAITPTV